MEKILIVDDGAINREMLRVILKDKYELLEAEDGEMALNILEEQGDEISALLLDLIMPKMDGFQVLERLNQNKMIIRIPVFVITESHDQDVENRCFDLGIADFITKPFSSRIVRRRVDNMVKYFAYKAQLEKKVEEQTAVLRKAFHTLQLQAEHLKKRNQDIIDMLGTVVEYRNLESGEHIQRVKDYTRLLAECAMKEFPEFELTDKKIDIIVAASALHDVGKISIPDRILLKPGRLSTEEFEYMKSHTIRGCEILDALEGDWEPDSKRASYEICRHHHERYDGKGYPDGLAGDEIPLSAQLVSIADVYDALVNERCYKDAYSTDEAYHMIITGECGVFSPKLMEAFRKVKRQFEALAHQ